MERRSIAWLVAGMLFTLGNIAGGVYAGMMGETHHARVHFLLAVVGACFTWRIVTKRHALTGLDAAAEAGAPPRELSSRLNSLEQSLDAIAVEVERVGESQRFMTRLFAERRERKPGDD